MGVSNEPIDDEQAKRIIEKVSKCKNVAEFQTLSISNRDKYLKKLRESGLSIRQISTLTGVSFNIVRKFQHTKEPSLCVLGFCYFK